MSGSSSHQGSFATYAKHRTKEILRRFIPAHKRFTRAGKSFLVGGEREVHLLPTLVAKGSTAIDVGAHIGDYTYSLCNAVGPQGRVVAIEPLPDLAKMLTRAIEQLKLPVTVINCALSSHPGEATLRVPVNDGRRVAGFATLENRPVDGQSFTVKLRTLDDIADEHPGTLSFIKIDVEGHELEVLKGATKTLQQRRPNLLIEIEQRHSTGPIEETFAFMAQQGYRAEFLDENGQLVSAENFSVAVHQNEQNVRTPRYVSNFIFKPNA